jgi:hypothetical protein
MNHTVVAREVVGSIRGVHQSSHHSNADILRCKAQFYFWRAKILTAQFSYTSAYIYTPFFANNPLSLIRATFVAFFL